MKSQIPVVDPILDRVARVFSLKLTVVRGVVEVLGRLENQKSWHTRGRTGFGGKINDNGWFFGGAANRSDTYEHNNFTVNLIKIGPTSLVNTQVSSSGLYDALNVGDNVACILSGNKSNLLCVNNLTTGVAFGFNPGWGGLRFMQWLCGVIGLLALLHLRNLNGSLHTPLTWLLIGILGFRTFQLAADRSRDVWQRASTELQRI